MPQAESFDDRIEPSYSQICDDLADAFAILMHKILEHDQQGSFAFFIGGSGFWDGDDYDDFENSRPSTRGLWNTRF